MIKNFTKLGSGVNQFFPTMLKTRIGDMGDGLNSIYDRIKEDVNKPLFYKAMHRGIRRDSMYTFSKSISLDMKENTRNSICDLIKRKFDLTNCLNNNIMICIILMFAEI